MSARWHWLEFAAMVLATLAICGMLALYAHATEPEAHDACRAMDGIPVLTADSGTVCVTGAIQVADTLPPTDTTAGEDG